MDGYAVAHADVAVGGDESPVHLPVVGEIGAGQAVPARDVARHRGEDHDRRPGAGRRRLGRALRVDRPRRRQRRDLPGAGAGAARPARRARTSARATCSCEPAPCSAPARSGCSRRSAAPRCGRVRVPGWSSSPPGPSSASRARRSATTRSTTATRSCSRPRPGRPARSPTASGSSPTSPRAFLDALNDQLVRADLVDHQRRRLDGRLRRRQGGARAAGHRVVRRRRDAAGQAAGLRHRRGGRRPDHHPAGQPGVVVHLLRAVRRCRPSAG